MTNFEAIEKQVEKKLRQKEKRKVKRMKVSGKNVFGLKKIIVKKSNKLSA